VALTIIEITHDYKFENFKDFENFFCNKHQNTDFVTYRFITDSILQNLVPRFKK